MKTTITISDFRFELAGYGRYKVTYTSPISGRSWTAKTDNMPLIDLTRNADEPKRRYLEMLRKHIKS